MGIRGAMRRKSASAGAPEELHDAAENFGAHRYALKAVQHKLGPAMQALSEATQRVQSLSEELDREARRLGIDGASPAPLSCTLASLESAQSAISSISEQTLALRREARDIKESLRITAQLRHELSHYAHKLSKLDELSPKRDSNKSKHDRTKASLHTTANATAKQIELYSKRQRVETELAIAALLAAEADSSYRAERSLSQLAQPHHVPEWLERASQSISTVAHWLRRDSAANNQHDAPDAAAAHDFDGSARPAPPPPEVEEEEENAQELYNPSEHRSITASDMKAYMYSRPKRKPHAHNMSAPAASAGAAVPEEPGATGDPPYLRPNAMDSSEYTASMHSHSEEVDRLRQKLNELTSHLEQKERECEGLRKAKKEFEEQAERRKNENTELQRRLRQERERMGHEVAQLKSQVRDASETASRSRAPQSPSALRAGGMSRPDSRLQVQPQSEDVEQQQQRQFEAKLKQKTRSQPKEPSQNQRAAMESDEDEDELDELTAL